MATTEAKKEDKTSVKNVAVKHEGSTIVLPNINGKPMSYDEAIEWMKRKKQEDEAEFSVHNTIICSPMDGAVAFSRAIAEIYGWSEGVPTPGFFSSRPPAMIGVNVSPTEKVDVLWGRIEIPGIEGFLSTGCGLTPQPHFHIGGVVKKKYAQQVRELVALTEKKVKEQSIYKGKAIKVGFDWLEDAQDGDRDYNPTEDCPHFMEMNGFTEDDLIFGESVQGALNIGLFTPVEQSEACRKFGVPLKRGILLYGPYGTGKTLTAHVTALKAIRSGWTFVYLNSVNDLAEGLKFAAQYAPAVLFAEDIDRVITGERSMSMDEVLNTLDGVDTKGGEIITVFTTNHIDQINPAMLRMGRLDTLVEVLPPDAAAAERLVRLYSRNLLSKDADLKKLGKALAGNIPAFIREVTERAKIAAIARMKGQDITGHVLEADLLSAADAMKMHAKLLEPKEEEKSNAPEMFVKVPSSAAAASKALSLAVNHLNGRNPK